MTTPIEPTKYERGTCPNCGSKNLRRLREGEQEFVVVPKRACKDCGTVFSPAVSPLLAVVTGILAAVALVVFVWGMFINEKIAPDMMGWVVWLALVTGLCLVMATVQTLRQREPKIHEVPRGPREAKPWDNPAGEG
jgi:uncharacterized protein (DUF983 family)